MTSPVYLFDASSLVKALKEAKLVPLGGQALQWLTVYEVLNALWKEAHLLKRLDPGEVSYLADVFAGIIENMVVLDPRGLESDIVQIALSRHVTVYDASYIALARRHGLKLVTEDRRLRQAAMGIVETIGLDDMSR
ncbi:MAG: type II toxin-antitoxin system VapC family toxin [Desulfurococcales archaeon]|nr:type II toxin-antitoxin system VapC family toxin [Desulfurococcales archaeon]